MISTENIFRVFDLGSIALNGSPYHPIRPQLLNWLSTRQTHNDHALIRVGSESALTESRCRSPTSPHMRRMPFLPSLTSEYISISTAPSMLGVQVLDLPDHIPPSSLLPGTLLRGQTFSLAWPAQPPLAQAKNTPKRSSSQHSYHPQRLRP